MNYIGLTLGKFAPLHKGHEYLLKTALSEVDELICLVYDCPEITNVPLIVRSKWIKSLFPKVEVINIWDGPLQVGDTPEIKQMHETYILKVLNGRSITHFFCSEFYGDHMSRALNAKNRLVDTSRLKFPISGTDIRQNPYKFREFISPIVYRDLITNIVFLGAPSTGKTTLAESFANEFKTVWMPEYGREYWELHQKNRRLSLEQLVEIADGHLIREDRLVLDANKYFFTDTNALTTYMFSIYYHGKAAPRLTQIADLCTTRYDLVFLCDSDIPYDDTWDRSGEANRQVFQKQIENDLIARQIPYITLEGSLEERIKKAKTVLGRFQKYQSIKGM